MENGATFETAVPSLPQDCSDVLQVRRYLFSRAINRQLPFARNRLREILSLQAVGEKANGGSSTCQERVPRLGSDQLHIEGPGTLLIGHTCSTRRAAERCRCCFGWDPDTQATIQFRDQPVCLATEKRKAKQCLNAPPIPSAEIRPF